MLKNISWQNFVTVLAWILIAWYCFVAMVYYSKNFQQLVRLNVKLIHQRKGSNQAISDERDADHFAQAQELRNEIAQLLQIASAKKYPKEELVMALQVCFKAYSALCQTGFQVAINHFIEVESEKQCATSFSEQELKMLWMG